MNKTTRTYIQQSAPISQQPVCAIPRWFSTRSFICYAVAFAVCILAFGYPMEGRYATISIISTLLFFFGGQSLSVRWKNVSSKTFQKRIFWAALIIRFIWIIYCYFFNIEYYGTSMGDMADVEWYTKVGKIFAEGFRNGEIPSFAGWDANSIDDFGYPFWLGVVYFFSMDFSDAFVPFIIKCFCTSYCVVCMYRTCKRHFGEDAARMAAIFVALMPNMIYWCGSMFKESEFVFLCCLFVDKMDEALSGSHKLSFAGVLPAALIGLCIFLFRAALGVVAFMAVLAHIVFASHKIMDTGKKVIAGLLVVGAILVGMGERFMAKVDKYSSEVQSKEQTQNMEWRSKRHGGNKLATYATTAVFAPLIVTIPFPTFNNANPNQILQPMQSGGYVAKNLLSFFIILFLFQLLLSGEWRQHVFLLAFVMGSLAMLALSHFAQSGRYHMTVIPMLLVLAAASISKNRTNKKVKKYYSVMLLVEVGFCLVWNWYKLAGRGMI